MSKFLDEEKLKCTHAFIQYKGTDICMDFYCECGKHLHFDGYFAYFIQCGYCGETYEMPPYLVPRKISKEMASKEILVVLKNEEDEEDCDWRD